jgi:hypothetical protein
VALKMSCLQSDRKHGPGDLRAANNCLTHGIRTFLAASSGSFAIGRGANVSEAWSSLGHDLIHTTAGHRYLMSFTRPGARTSVPLRG